MTRPEAVKVQKQIESILNANNIHYTIEYVSSPNLKFINIGAAIKITKD